MNNQTKRKEYESIYRYYSNILPQYITKGKLRNFLFMQTNMSQKKWRGEIASPFFQNSSID